MGRKLKAKFGVNHLQDNPEYKTQLVKMNTVCDTINKGSENNQFSIATPWGNMEMMISNPAAFDFFTQGKNYILTFEEAED